MAELKKMESDPSYNINIIGDIKQMLKELGTEKAKEIALHGGGGSKAKNERAAALAAILEARSRIKDDIDSKSDEKPKQTYSIVDSASAAVHGRSAAAAKADVSHKTAARIAAHMAGERVPVNAKMVSYFSSEKFICHIVNIKKVIAEVGFAICMSNQDSGKHSFLKEKLFDIHD